MEDNEANDETHQVHALSVEDGGVGSGKIGIIMQNVCKAFRFGSLAQVQDVKFDYGCYYDDLVKMIALINTSHSRICSIIILPFERPQIGIHLECTSVRHLLLMKALGTNSPFHA